jgi:dienelactone hydrolase
LNNATLIFLPPLF